jgi:hypothetical protein
MDQVITICLWLVQVVLRPEQTKGFGTLKKRWVVERMVGWLMHCRRLVHDIGLQLGAIWEEQTVRLPLAGNLARVEARGLFIHVQIGSLEPVRLAFAWAQASQVPLILGQTNFFREFDVCFQRSKSTIEIIH